jgi:hypothetical protein
MSEGRRYSFEDAINRRARELEQALEVQREVIRTEGQQQIADIQRVSTEARAGLDHAAAERTTAIHWGASEHREELGGLTSGETEAIERAAMEAREEFMQAAAAEARRIDERVAASHDAMRKAAAEQTAAFEESMRARLVEIEDALRAEAARTRSDMRRAADEEAAAFDKVAGERVTELQDAMSAHSEMLDELTRLHSTTTDQIEEVRSLIAELQQEAQERRADLDATGAGAGEIQMLVQGLVPGGDRSNPASMPDLRGLDHEGRVVGIETLADERFANLNRYVERSEAAQRALEERLADLEDEVAESVQALDERALAATASRFEAKLRAAADEHTRKLEQAGVVTKNQLLDALARAEEGLAQAAEARSTDLGEMIAAARTTIERAADTRVESLESTAVELRDGIEDLHRDIAVALKRSGADQAASLDRAAADWLERMDGAGGRRRKHGGSAWGRRAAPSATAVVLVIAAALGGTLFLRGLARPGGSRTEATAAAIPAADAAAATDAPPANHPSVGPLTPG